MTIPQGTAYYFLNGAGEIARKVTWSDVPNTTIIYVKPDGTQAPDGNYPPADEASSFGLYSDGSLESYRHLGEDGSLVWLKFAPAAPGTGKIYGPNGEYRAGDTLYSETLAPTVTDTGVKVLVHTVKSYYDGNVTGYEHSYGTPDTSAAVIRGTYDAATNTSTVSLANSTLASPITMSGLGTINPMNGLTVGFIGMNGLPLVGNDGSTLVGQDGGTLIQTGANALNLQNVHSLVGNDGSTLVGNDGSTLISDNGAIFSGIGTNTLDNGNSGMLAANDASTLVGADAAMFMANTLASFLGYSAYANGVFDDDSEPSVDTVAADVSTTAVVDLFGTFSSEVETAGDRDWIKVELKAGETYTITVNGTETGDGTLVDPHLKLLSATGTLVVEDEDSGTGTNAELTFTAAADATYFVEASANGGGGVGTYEIGVHAQTIGFVKDGATINNITGAGFFSETSITSLSDGGYAVGFTARIDGQRAYNQSYHAQIEIIDAAGDVVDLDARPDFSTWSIFRGGDYNNLPGPVQVTAGEDGSFKMIVSNTVPIEWGMIRRAEVVDGSSWGLGPSQEVTPISQPGVFRTYGTSGVDIATLANGNYIASMSGGGYHGTEVSNENLVQISINGALPKTIDDSGIRYDYQQTSVSALGKGAVIVWTDAAADPSGSGGGAQGVIGAIVDAQGNVKYTFEVNQTEARAQYVDSAAAVAELADGGFVVAWTGKEDDPNHADPYADSYCRVFNADGTPRSVEMVLGIEQGGDQGRAMVIGLPSGGFAASWISNGSIRLQQFDDSGQKVGAEVEVGRGGGHSMTLAPDGKLAIAYKGDGMLRVQIMEPNKAPTDLVLSNKTIAETPDSSAYDVIVGTLSASDANASDTFTYQLLNNADGLFRIDGNTLRWNSYSVRPDFEAHLAYEIQVKVTDSLGQSVIKSFNIDVSDVNEAPTDMTPGSVVMDENTAVGSVIATLNAVDPDENETFTYELVADGGVAVPFAIDGDKVVVTSAVDYETQQTYYSLTIRVTDSAGHSINRQFAVGVQDVAPIIFEGTSKPDVKDGAGEDDNLAGQGGNDKLDGKGGNDTLSGGVGKDRLTGGDGHDDFVFDTKFAKKQAVKVAESNADIIVDFTVGDDTFVLSGSAFKKIGTNGLLSESEFAVSNKGEAADKFDRIIYEADTGALYFDADGRGKTHDALLFATVGKDLDLTAADFAIS